MSIGQRDVLTKAIGAGWAGHPSSSSCSSGSPSSSSCSSSPSSSSCSSSPSSSSCSSSPSISSKKTESWGDSSSRRMTNFYRPDGKMLIGAK